MQQIHVTIRQICRYKNQKGNVNGHIIRFKETADKTTAESFKWDIYLFGAEASGCKHQLSGLTDNNDFHP
jgi:secreted PhoX family phosphatase